MTGDNTNVRGRVIWITGLSGAGKTTLARALQARLPGSVVLDGDEMRAVLGDNAGFDAASRKNLGFTYARMAGLLARQGLTVLVATISMYHELHTWSRETLPGYVEIFLDIPEEERRRRDPKGLYAAARSGRVRHMAGHETPVQPPLRPDLVLSAQPLDAAVQAVLSLLSLHPLPEKPACHPLP